MFVLICFGYKLFKYYTIDCLTASLADAIWIGCVKETIKHFNAREEIFTKEIQAYNKRLQVAEKKYEIIIANEKRDELLNKDDATKGTAKNAPPAKGKAAPAKKGAKGAEQTLSKQEQDKLNTENEIQKCKDMNEKYKQKQIK